MSALLLVRYTTDFYIAEIDRLKKQESAAKSKEVPELKRPDGQITDLQKAMGLDDERVVYISCHVSVSCYSYLLLPNLIYSQPFTM